MFWFFFLVIRYSLGTMLLIPLFLIRKSLRERRFFEVRNKAPAEGKKAKIWFHASSEGEWEQIWPVITNLLEESNEPMHIWYTSPSLEKKALKMCEQHDRLTCGAFSLLCFLPLAKRNILSWSSPELFFMVRYDFFPELLWKGFRAKNFVLLSATVKNKEKSLTKNFLKRTYAKSLYGLFTHIFAASKKDQEFFSENLKVSGDVVSHDFRHAQIIKRQQEKPHLEETHCLKELNDLWQDYEPQQRIILGSLWFDERSVFDESLKDAIKNKEVFVFIAPHKLKGEEWDKIVELVEDFKEEGMDTFLWDEVGIHGRGNLALCQVPGLLCELYPYFGHAFVGGGHGRSVHSILEPFWGGCHVFCGPKTHRSTEFDFAKEQSPRHLHVVRELPDFYSKVRTANEVVRDVGHRENLGEDVLRANREHLENFRELI